MVGPGKIAFEGRGWRANCLEFKEDEVDDHCVWNSATEVQGFFHRIEDLKRLTKSLGFRKPKTKKENMNRILAQIKKKRLLESIGESSKHDMNKYFGKTIIIGLISDVFCKCV